MNATIKIFHHYFGKDSSGTLSLKWTDLEFIQENLERIKAHNEAIQAYRKSENKQANLKMLSDNADWFVPRKAYRLYENNVWIDTIDVSRRNDYPDVRYELTDRSFENIRLRKENHDEVNEQVFWNSVSGGNYAISAEVVLVDNLQLYF